MKFLISFIANSGLHTPHKNGRSKCSILGPCSHFHGNAVYAGWAMFTGWMMDASPKDLLYGELATTGARLSGRPRLRFKDICKRGMKACNIDTNAWETLADNRNLWKQQVSQGLKSGEAPIVDKSDERRARRITCNQQDHPAPQPASVFICQGRSRDRKSRITWPLQQHKTMFLNQPSQSSTNNSIIWFLKRDWICYYICVRAWRRPAPLTSFVTSSDLAKMIFFLITVWMGNSHPSSEHLNRKANGTVKKWTTSNRFLRGNLFCYFFYSKYIGKEKGSVPRAQTLLWKLFSTSWRLVGVGTSFSRSRVEADTKGVGTHPFQFKISRTYPPRSNIEVRAIHLSILSGYF